MTLKTQLAAALVVATSSAFAATDAPADLLKQATITKAQATATALAKVPNRTVKSSELEQEGGKLIWSFDIFEAVIKEYH